MNKFIKIYFSFLVLVLSFFPSLAFAGRMPEESGLSRGGAMGLALFINGVMKYLRIASVGFFFVWIGILVFIVKDWKKFNFTNKLVGVVFLCCSGIADYILLRFFLKCHLNPEACGAWISEKIII